VTFSGGRRLCGEARVVPISIIEQHTIFQYLKCEWFAFFQQSRELSRRFDERLDDSHTRRINLNPAHWTLEQDQHVRIAFLFEASAGLGFKEDD